MGCRGPLLLGFMLLALAETGKQKSISFGHYQHDFWISDSQVSAKRTFPSPSCPSSWARPFGSCTATPEVTRRYFSNMREYCSRNTLTSPSVGTTFLRAATGNWQPFLALPRLTLLTIFRLQAAQIISILKFIIILCVLASFNPFPFLGVDTPAWAAWMLENKIYACMMTFFLCNAVETQVKMHSILPCF